LRSGGGATARRRAGRQGAEGGGDALDGGVGGHVADDHHLDGALGQLRGDLGLEGAELGLGDLAAAWEGEAPVASVQQAVEIAGQHAVVGGLIAIMDRAAAAQQALEGFGPPAWLGHIGRQNLHLGGQVAGPCRAGQKTMASSPTAKLAP
jgi:hypothetical protein